MKKALQNQAALFIVGLIIFTSCYREGIVGIRGVGPIVTDKIYLDDFNAIDLQISGDVFFEYGTDQEIIIEGQQNIIDNIKRRVRDGKWEIDFDKNVRSYDGLDIFITLPYVNEIELSGSGDIESYSEFEAGSIDFYISGSGNIDFAIDANYAYSHISGSGNILLSGITNRQEIHISGSGNYKAYSCETDQCEINISGSGNAKVYVNDLLDVNISGSGNVYYMGFPDINYNISGSGSIISVN